MTTTDEVERFSRERQEADRRYNDALTALDRAVVAAAQGIVSPAELGTALMVFLQQITAFVESKDREIATGVSARLTTIERAIEPVAELRARMSVVQRAVQALTHAAARVPAAADPAAAKPGTRGRAASDDTPRVAADDAPRAVTEDVPRAAAHDADDGTGSHDYKYVGFEDQFRGQGEVIAAQLAAYVPIFAGAGPVIDLGCGRGELLQSLRVAGIAARGVDANATMVTIARNRGLDAVQGDALGFLHGLEDESAGGIIATQVIEHLEPAYLMRLIDTASRKLRRGGPIVLETINAACWLAFFSSYLRDFTHIRPVHPDTLQYLLRACGFERVEIRYSAPVPDHMKMRTVDLPPAVTVAGDATSHALTALAHAVNANAVILNNLMFTHLDYAAIGYRA